MAIPSRSGQVPPLLGHSIAILAFAVLQARALDAVDFIRGDANGDGAVTIADACWIAAYPEFTVAHKCALATDVDDDGGIGLSDSLFLLSALFLGGAPIPPPFPLPGPDPTDDSDPWVWYTMECKEYGGGAPLEMPGAKLQIPDAVAPGGASRMVDLWLSLTAGWNLGARALYARIQLPEGVVQDVVEVKVPPPIDEQGPALSPELRSARMLDGNIIEVVIVYTGLYSPWRLNPLLCPAAGEVQAVGITLCLRDGIPAGEYPLLVETAELAGCFDFETQEPAELDPRAAYPALEGGKLIVEEDISSAEECTGSSGTAPLHLDAVYRIGSGAAPPGGSFVLPFTIRANCPIGGYCVSVDFDEGTLEATGLDFPWERPDGSPYDFLKFEINNEDLNPGEAGVDEGYLAAVAVFDLVMPPDFFMPADTNNLAARFHFRVRPETTASVTEIRFLDGGQGDFSSPVHNVLLAYIMGMVTPETANTFLFMNGRVDVIPDVATFVRGDSNGDGSIDLSDAVSTLGFLFLGSTRPACLDAADFNDDGIIDMSDPVGTVGFLFLSLREPPPPSVSEGPDPTEDSMGCLYFY